MVKNHLSQDLASPDLEQDFSYNVVPAIYEHFQAEDYQEALEILNNFYEAKADRDENNWLKYKCDAWKALIFEKQGRYLEALSLYKSLAEVMGSNHTLFTYFQVDLARVLHKLGNNLEARIAIEKALEESTNSSISDKLTALNLYVCILENCHETIPIQRLDLVNNLAKELGIKCEPINLSKSVKELSQKNQEANRRYSLILIELDQIEDDRQAEGLLRKYISEESVGYYRNLAIKELDELAD